MASQTLSTKVLQVAILAWSGMDLTDFAAPVETLSHGRNDEGERLYRLSIASDYDLADTTQTVQIKRTETIEKILARIHELDVLIIPGGGGFTASNIPEELGLKRALETFIQLPPRPERPRVLLSICAGVFFLAQTGVLNGKIATAHYKSLAELHKLSPTTTVVRQHYVDVGTVNGLQIIVSGGIASGFDASLYLIEIQHGYEVAERSRATMDGHWRREALPFGFFASQR